MDSYPDYLVRAIRRKFAPDIMTALRDADPMTLCEPNGSVNVPLRAGVGVIYRKELAAFIIDATIKGFKHAEGVRFDNICGRQLFSTRELVEAKDKVAIIEYLFDQAKRHFIEKLVNDELEYILKTKEEPSKG